MSRLSEEEIQAIMEKYGDAPMVNPDKIYPPLPPVQNVTPLIRIPEPMSITERIGGTEYTVNAHFRKDGRDLLSMLTDIFHSLCMQGKGVSAIVTALWEDKVLTPSAYKASKGIGVAKKSERPYNWEPARLRPFWKMWRISA